MDIYHFVQRNSLGFLICFVLLLSRCSGNNVRDKFVFGKIELVAIIQLLQY